MSQTGSLQDAISNWDQKSRTGIAAIYDSFAGKKAFVAHLLDMLDEPDLQRGASWLLKHHCEVSKKALLPQQAEEIFSRLNRLQNWETRLHILQIMQFLPISPHGLPAVEYFVRDSLTSDNKFVRAWGFSAFATIARQFPHLQPEARELLGHALQHDAAGSVKARIRNELKQGFDCRATRVTSCDDDKQSCHCGS